MKTKPCKHDPTYPYCTEDTKYFRCRNCKKLLQYNKKWELEVVDEKKC